MVSRARSGVCKALLALVVACGADTDSTTPDPALAEPQRQTAPGFSLSDLDGTHVTLESLRGKIVVIDFWATWCPPCIFQVPILNEVQQAFRDRDVVVLGVSVDTEGIEVVREFAAEHDVRYTVLLGDESLARAYGAPGFPWMVVVWPDGTLDPGPAHVGLVEQQVLEEKLGALTRQLGPPDPARQAVREH